MIKYFCDRCGKDLEGAPRIGYIAVNIRDMTEGELMEDNEFEKCHYCVSCIDEIRKFVRSIPAENATESEETDTKATESVAKQEESVAKQEGVLLMERGAKGERPKL